jgi:hypothetical protein
LTHVEVAEHKRGTGWLADWLVERVDRHNPAAVLFAQNSPAAALQATLENGVWLTPVPNGEYAQAYGVFFDAVDQRTVRHLGTQEFVTAIRGAARQTLGDAWKWSRKASHVDITPLVAGTLAVWYAQSQSLEGDSVWAFTAEELAGTA